MNLENNKNIKDRVTDILQKSLSARDNHNVTIYQYYLKYGKKDYPMFSDWFVHNVSTCNSIERQNRKLQEQNEELRGAKYKERKIKEIEVTNFIRQGKL